MMMRLRPLILLLCLLPLGIFAQSFPFLWKQQGDAVDASVLPSAVGTDSKGNVYVCGHFGDQVYWGSQSFQSVTPPSSDIFLVKFDSSGNFRWGRTFGSAGSDYAFGLTVDHHDVVYICGQTTSDSLQLDSYLLEKGAHHSIGYWAKFDGDGLCLLAGQSSGYAAIPAVSRNYFTDIKVDREGKIYLTGGFRADSLRLRNKVIANHRPSGQVTGSNVFVARLDMFGITDWLVGSGPGSIPAGDDTGLGLAIGQDGTVYFCGKFGGIQLVLGNRTLKAFDWEEGFCAALEGESGQFIWARALRGFHIGSNTYDEIGSITADEQGRIYVSGGYVGSEVNFDSVMILSSPLNPSVHKACLFQLDAQTGLPNWGKLYGESANGSANTRGLAWDNPRNRLLLVVNYGGNPNIPGISLPTAASSNGALLELDLQGNVQRGIELKGAGNQQLDDVVVDPFGATVVLGRYGGVNAQWGNQFTFQNPQQPNTFFSMMVARSGSMPLANSPYQAAIQPSVFPSPFNNEISYRLPLPSLHRAVLYSATGQIVWDGGTRWTMGESIATQGLPNGVYFLTLTGENLQYTARVLRLD